jgi:hypothetical protein
VQRTDEAPGLSESALLSPARGALSASLLVGVSFDRLNRAGAGTLDDAYLRREDHDVPFVRRVGRAGLEDQAAKMLRHNRDRLYHCAVRRARFEFGAAMLSCSGHKAANPISAFE